MNLLVLGATGGSGRALVDYALEQGHVVTAFARSPTKVRVAHPNLRVVKGDVLNYESVEPAIHGQDAVLSALGIRVPVVPFIVIAVACQLVARTTGLHGPTAWLVRIGIPLLSMLFLYRRKTTLSEGTGHVVRAMEKLGVKRFVCESSLGIGDSRGQLGFFYNWLLIPLLLRNIFADKEAQEKIIRQSRLDWVIVRPAVLTNGPRTGLYRHGFGASDRSIQGRISRADVAEFMLKQCTSDVYLRKTPGVSH